MIVVHLVGTFDRLWHDSGSASRNTLDMVWSMIVVSMRSIIVVQSLGTIDKL